MLCNESVSVLCLEHERVCNMMLLRLKMYEVGVGKDNGGGFSKQCVICSLCQLERRKSPGSYFGINPGDFFFCILLCPA